MSRTDQLLVAAGAAAVLLATASAWLLLSPATDTAEDDPLVFAGVPNASEAVSTGGPSPTQTAGSAIVVDVQGAVAQPGIHRLPAGSRVADAIAAAGGYGPTVDLDATAAAINLARALDDGEQIRVPARGETHAAGDGTAAAGGGAADGAGGGGAAGGLVDLNSATPEELEALPGIGPVTAQKIVAGRQERPFSSLEDAVDRKVMNRGQLEQIRDLATAG